MIEKNSHVFSITSHNSLEETPYIDESRESLVEISQYINHLYKTVKETDQIPIKEIEQYIIPLISKASTFPHLFQFFHHDYPSTEYICRHNLGVTIVSTIIAKWLDLSLRDIERVAMSALLRDIGNVKIPSTILNKPGKLTKTEFEILKEHTIFGQQLISQSEGGYEDIAIVALQHHEREGGQGYPFGLRSEQIHLFSKIVAIADIFMAMLSKRSYKEANPLFQVIKQMHHEMYGKLAPDIAIIFLRRILDLLTGQKVILSDGQTAKIIMINKYHLFKPLIQIGEEIIDLSIHPELEIERLMD
ncbi:HD-GYP domain-containing protein [Litchfieldia alkalitelluris]|uniref:HD-GYP domain-containing protein n=1 Tax=Litchfieldia alkalitelluris TaxID=304268 RepID=UPI0009971AD9|nr:HD domain-containing phosphohydrolase [Litchfieldia alkalitelluris]